MAFGRIIHLYVGKFAVGNLTSQNSKDFSQFDIEACRKHVLDYANFQFLSSEGTMRTDFKAIINIKPENE